MKISDVFESTCWDSYERVPGTKKYSKGSCRKKKTNEAVFTNKITDKLEDYKIIGSKHPYYLARNKNNKQHALILKKWSKGYKIDAEGFYEDEEWEFSGVSGQYSVLYAPTLKLAFNDWIRDTLEEQVIREKEGGMSDKERKAYNRKHGSNLKRAQPSGGKRRTSYCARSKGQMDMHNIDCRIDPDKPICKARRDWNC